MKVLGIETSCDETAVCLIEAEGDFGSTFKCTVLGNALLSQAETHRPYGGVFPNLAKREHSKNLVPILHTALQQHIHEERSNTQLPRVEILKILEREQGLFEQLIDFLETYSKPDIDCIAVTVGPGLEPALWVGVNLARALSTVWDVPIVGVNHMEGHIAISMMDIVSGFMKSQYRDFASPDIVMRGSIARFQFPALALLISGGHTELVFMQKFGQYEFVGQTRDDAVGEAFDKVARLLQLPYPGGPEIEKLAEEARYRGLVCDISLPRPMQHDTTYDFSFSGLKTAVRRIVELQRSISEPLSENIKRCIAREFEDAVTDVLVAKTLRAIETYGTRTLIVGGGVSANTHIRSELSRQLLTVSCQLLMCPPELATDNALMIALAGYFHAAEGDFIDPATLRANGNLELAKQR